MNYCSCVKTGLLIILLFAFSSFQAAAQPIERPPQSLSAAIKNMLDFADSSRDVELDIDLIPHLLDFVDAPKQLGEAFPLDENENVASDYYEFTINRSFAEVVDLVYNPDLPPFLTQPSSVRRSHWIEINGQSQPFPALGPERIDPKTPLIVKGVEFIENCPSRDAGSYYAYQLERALILMMYQGRRVLISISTQPNKSQVGKKGLVLGNEREWNFLYTGETGTTVPGLGWADTFIYDSAAIMVYYEAKDSPQQVKCGVLNWLNAGWLGMNFVQPRHVRRGLVRFADDFRAIMESPKLPALSELIKIFQGINALPINELRIKSRDYFDHLQRHYRHDDPKYDQWFAKLFTDQTYLESLNREEMQALISFEYLKCLMGKPLCPDTACFAASIAQKDPSIPGIGQ